jgi:hypothetical protein
MVDDDREAPEPDAAGDVRFVRYQNRFYRVMTMGGGGLVLILGLTGAALSRTLDPPPPIQWMWLDLGVTAVLFTWYALGMRCGLDVADDWVEINTKYGTRRIDRAEIESVEPDLSFWGSLQPAGRPLVVNLAGGKRYKAPASLPSDRLGLASAVAELQGALGRPEVAHQVELEASMARRLATMTPDADPEVSESMARRLASMVPEGDGTVGTSEVGAAAGDGGADGTGSEPDGGQS